MTERVTVSEVARLLAVELGGEIRPREISDLFYQRTLAEQLGPLVGGRRMIALNDLPLVKAAVLARRREKVPSP